MNIRVLVADDFPLVRDGVVRTLGADPGIDVVGEAETGPEALRLTLALAPDVLLLDLRMPELDGLAVLARVRAERPAVKVVVMTASESAETLIDAVAGGAQGYLSKRTTCEELRQAIITAHGGGSVVTPALAKHLLQEFSHRARGETSTVRAVVGPREVEILRALARGKTDNEIGLELSISPRTVQNHLGRIRTKIGLRRRSELTRWAVQHALV